VRVQGWKKSKSGIPITKIKHHHGFAAQWFALPALGQVDGEAVRLEDARAQETA